MTPPGGLADRLLLFRLASRRLDVLLTAAVVLLLAASRFSLLACGPWEWDETLFARGLLHFELAAHFPHPPGFPGWLAIGGLLMPLAGEPLRALQWGSAALSVLALWPLAALGRRVAPAPVAVLAALLVLAAPGPWLYAVRGFSSTPAATFALAAAAVAVGGLAGRRATAFTLLVVAAFLIRPILLPSLGVLWLAGAVSVRPWRRLLPGLAGAAVMVLASIAAMARAEGGWQSFAGAFLAHTDKHFSRLVHDTGGLANLGLVKGLGPWPFALALAAISLAGLGVWARRNGRRSAAAWLLVLGVTVVQLVAIQNRTYARYAVPVHLAMAPLVAAAASTLPPVVAISGLLAATGWMGASSHPLLAEQHERPLPGWSAVRAAFDVAAERRVAVVVEPELHPFASYLWHLREREGVERPPLVLSPWAPEPWAGVDEPYLVATVHRHHYARSIAGGELAWAGVSDALEPYTQQRFLEAWVISAPPLPVGDWWPVENAPDGTPFQWAGARAGLVLPPLPAGTTVEAVVRLAPGPASLAVLWNGEPLATTERGDRLQVSVEPARVRSGEPNLLAFRRASGYPPGSADPRPLAVQLLGVDASGPALPWQARAAVQEELQRHAVRVGGAYPPERFGAAGDGVWLAPDARLELSTLSGRLGLTLMAPRPTPPRPHLRVAGAEHGPLDIGPDPETVWLSMPGGPPGDRTVVEIASEPYRPSDDGAADPRALGVVLLSLRFEPDAAPAWTRPLAAVEKWRSREVEK